MATIFGQMDNGELSSRISPINQYDRRGNVVWWTDMNDALTTWLASTSGTGASVDHSIARVYHGDKSIKLTCGSTDGARSGISRLFNTPVTSKLGCEMAVSVDTYIDYIWMRLGWYDGSKYYLSGLNLDITNNTVEYWDGTAWQNMLGTTYTFDKDSHLWYHLKFVWDYSTKKYIRGMFAEHTVDLSSVTITGTAVAQAPENSIEIRAHGTATKNPAAYVGLFILTQNDE